MVQLQRELSLRHVLAIIIGTVIGSGIFINVPVVQKVAGSPWIAVMAWILGGLIWLPQIFILSEMGSAYPEEGFGYLYFRKAGSSLLAFLYVWTVFWTSDTPSITILAVSAVSALEIFAPILADSIWTRILAALIIILLTTVHYRSVRKGGNLQIWFTILKISPLILLSFIGLLYLKSPHLQWVPFTEIKVDSSTFPEGLQRLTAHLPALKFTILLFAGVSATVWSYAGFPNILYMAGEVKDASRILPKALIGSTIFVTVVYALVALATAALVPHNELVSLSGTFANPFKYLPLFATFAGAFLAIAAFLSMVGCANACIMVQPRIEYAIARDGLFFKQFGYLHPRFGTPANSILLQSGVAILLLLMGNLENLLGYFTLSYLLQNLLVYFTIFWLRKRNDYQPHFRSPWWLIMTILSILFQGILLLTTFLAYPLMGVLSSLILILTGLPIYYYFRHQHPEIRKK